VQSGQVSYANTFGLAAPTDDIDTVLDAVASKMGFRLKRQNAGGSKVVEDSASPNALRSAQHLIKQYRAGALGKFVLDTPDITV
jgi:ribosome biogenesis GTPase A